MHKSRRYVQHRLHYSHFKSIRSQVCWAEKEDAFNAGQWLQVSDVTDSWPIIVWRFGVFDPLKHFCCWGKFKTTFGFGGKECYDCSRWHWYNTVTPPTAGGASLWLSLAAAALSSRHFINLSERGYVWLCLWLPHPLTLMLLLIHLTSISPPGVFHILFNEQ